ncbi:sensor histidine kinase [Flavobacterium agricola]|uniref:histidine kinase n=1 Tax=Flavobacterium agricola TaxID=2870839 RepID=A0ABY6LWN9_9FLAO|nr:sensor histidine kinase [Flavobacterium agricola]UYW00586.1 sensor histidine kinase [Flavobacterium agricola]
MKYFIPLFSFLLLLLACNKKEPVTVLNFNDSYFEQLDSLNQAQYLDSLFLNSKYNSSLYFKIAEEFYYLRDLEKSNNVSRNILKHAKAEKDSANIGRAYYYIGDCYEFTYKDSAYYFYKQAEKIYAATKNTDRLAKVLFNKGYVLFYDGVYTESEMELTRALHYLKDSDNYLLKYQCFSLQGGNLEALALYSDALHYYKEAEKMIAKLTVSDEKKFYYQVINTVDLSNVYAAQKDYKNALHVLNKIDLKRLQSSLPIQYATVISNIGNNQLKLYGPNTEIKDYLVDAVQITKEHGKEIDLVYKYKYLGEYYLEIQDKEAANKYFKWALDAALNTNYNIEILNILKTLSKSDPENFDSYHSNYLDRYQQLIDKQIKTKNKFARIEYDTSRIEDMNKSLSARIQYGIYITIIVLLVIGTIALWRINQSNKTALNNALLKNKAEEMLFSLLQEQQKLIDKAQKTEKERIALELHDGVMNKLYSTRLNLGMLNKSSDEEAIETRKKLIKDLQNIEAEIRALSHNLSNQTGEFSNDYKKLLLDLVQSNNELHQTHFDIAVNQEAVLLEISTVLKVNIYRIVQEACQNILKHAHAKHAQITIDFDADYCFLTIQDDGVGGSKSANPGIGMKNMQQRVKTLKGTIEISTKPGFTIKIKIPIQL